MEVNEFQYTLNRGLGRAILHLQKHDSAPYRDVILQACLKNTTYDRQVEGGKLVYMTHIIELTGEKEYYRQHILDAARKIDKDTASYDREHILDLVQSFAQEGDKEARHIIYVAFSSTPPPGKNDWWGASRIVEVDGFKGFLFVANLMGKYIPTNDELFSYTYMLSEIEEMLGKEIVDEKLNIVRQENANIDAYLKIVEVAQAEQQQRKHKIKTMPKRAIQTYEEIKQLIDNSEGMYFAGWGQDVDASSLLQVATDLLDVLQQNDTARLRKYLQIFGKTAFPLDPQPLLKLIDYADDNKYFPIPIVTLNMLQNITHSSVRVLALRLINENRFTGRAVRLLTRNFQSGDWQRLEEITQRKLDDEDYHSLELSIRNIFDDHPTKDAIPALLNLYNNGICSRCRYGIIANLHSIDALPDSIRKECLYDSYEDTRELAKRNFEPEAK